MIDPDAIPDEETMTEAIIAWEKAASESRMLAYGWLYLGLDWMRSVTAMLRECKETARERSMNSGS